jgi:hypothetical protein
MEARVYNMLKAKASDRASYVKQFSLSEQGPEAGI